MLSDFGCRRQGLRSGVGAVWFLYFPSSGLMGFVSIGLQKGVSWWWRSVFSVKGLWLIRGGVVVCEGGRLGICDLCCEAIEGRDWMGEAADGGGLHEG